MSPGRARSTSTVEWAVRVRATRILCTVLLAAASAPALALDGRGLMAVCQDEQDQMGQALCLGYLTGVTEAVTSVVPSSGVCAPEGLAPGDLRAALSRYVDAHPEALAKPAVSVVWSAIVAAWPCPGMKRLAPAPGG